MAGPGTPGLAGAGSVGIGTETVLGTAVAPTLWVPILNENLTYDENRYFSPQIRQSVVVSDVEQGYYHVAGDIELEVDMNNFPYWLYASRHTPTVVAGPPNTGHTFVPSQAGSTSTGSGTVAKTLTITVVRNSIAFHYYGCTVGSIKLDINSTDGILKATLGIVGQGVTEDTTLGTPSWVAADLYGASCHTVLTGATGLSPTFTATSGYDGFTFEANHQAEPQNRIIPTRAAAFVKYGETMVTFDTTLDFETDTDYNNFVSTTQTAVQLMSIKGGSTWAACTEGLRLTIYRGVFEKYDIPLKGLADIVTAAVTGRGIGIAGGNAYKIETTDALTIA